MLCAQAPPGALPSSDDVAQREQLRGLGAELLRLDVSNHHSDLATPDVFGCGVPRDRPYRCSWQPLFRPFLPTVDPGLHGILDPYQDATLLEAHGEQLLDVYITKAPEAVWKSWLFSSLRVAVRADRVDLFRRLFAFENDPIMAELLYQAANNGSAGVLSALLELDDNIQAVQEMPANRAGPSLLIVASMHGHRSCVAALVKAGAPLEYMWQMGGTALLDAVQWGHEGVVEELVAAGADPDRVYDGDEPKMMTSSFGNYTPLGIAVAKSNMRMMDILLAAGAGFGKDRTHRSKWEGNGGREAYSYIEVPVIIAALRGLREPLERLLSAGADPNVVDAFGRSALHLACFHGQVGAVEVLLRHNAFPAQPCDKGLSPSDVVAVGALKNQECRNGKSTPTGTFFSPATLDAAETAVANIIHDMLERAGAWGRRGWLVMLRSRRVAAAGGGGGKTPAEAGDGWRCAVKWLLQCPDDSGLFREIVGFV